MRRQYLASLIAVLLAVLLALSVAGPAEARRDKAPATTAVPPYPSSMSALGDSITRGFNASGWFSDWPSRSWSTGTYSTVKSHAARLRVYNSSLTAYNDARTGAKMAALPTQATTAASRGAQYVTILLGANDACTDTEAGMTSVANFATQFETGLRTLAGQTPQPKVFVASIPDLYRLYTVGKNSSSARNAWAAYGICQSMLARPLSTDASDVSRRERVRQRVIDYNAKLAEICTSATYSSMCRYDGGVVFSYPFTLSQLSTWDYFHPNTAGQAVLAEKTWAAGFGW